METGFEASSLNATASVTRQSPHPRTLRGEETPHPQRFMSPENSPKFWPTFDLIIWCSGLSVDSFGIAPRSSSSLPASTRRTRPLTNTPSPCIGKFKDIASFRRLAPSLPQPPPSRTPSADLQQPPPRQTRARCRLTHLLEIRRLCMLPLRDHPPASAHPLRAALLRHFKRYKKPPRTARLRLWLCWAVTTPFMPTSSALYEAPPFAERLPLLSVRSRRRRCNSSKSRSPHPRTPRVEDTPHSQRFKFPENSARSLHHYLFTHRPSKPYVDDKVCKFKLPTAEPLKR
ncbi:hypothetical protein R3P38DRAFT_2802005 [Favolaschia claudopus]|uniref:Uncharacterized protein n=1 Tax=Favolaschia claudopus TaxID=2862362 RepID=A0AAV9ZVD8_9AGAR